MDPKPPDGSDETPKKSRWHFLLRILDTATVVALVVAVVIIVLDALIWPYVAHVIFFSIVFLLVLASPLLILIGLYAIGRVWFSRRLAISLSILIATLLIQPLLFRGGLYLFYAFRGQRLDAFVQDIISDRKIWILSDCQRYSKQVNNYYTNPCDTLYGGDWHTYFVNCLNRDSIPPERLDRYINELREARLISYEITRDGIVFIYDGFLDNEFGFLYLLRNNPPEEGSALESHGRLVKIVPIRRGWYYFATM